MLTWISDADTKINDQSVVGYSRQSKLMILCPLHAAESMDLLTEMEGVSVRPFVDFLDNRSSGQFHIWQL